MTSFILKDGISLRSIKNALGRFFIDENLKIDLLAQDQIFTPNDISFECRKLEGNFSFELTLYSRISFSVIKLAKYLSQTFKTQVVLSDESTNPYSWTLIDQNNPATTVYQEVREDDVFNIKT